ncbi:hypothetical protein Tamer19_11590 [Cupriavidus sp. TA19]|nr:hypothetical protein Tamer19_11590 [Cupriavidus sp. TA19]
MALSLTIWAPTGKYDPNSLANPSLNIPRGNTMNRLLSNPLGARYAPAAADNRHAQTLSRAHARLSIWAVRGGQSSSVPA